MSRQAFILLIVGAGLASLTFAQCGPAEWHSANAYPGPNGSTQCSTLWDPDGAGPLQPALTVGGNFTIAGSELANSVAWWDGSAWHGIGVNQLTGPVTELATWNGALVAGNGTFGGSGVVIWNGTSWGPLGTGTNSVSTALLEYGGELYSGQWGGGMPPLVKWDGASWQSVPTSVVSGVLALTLHNGALIAGGASALATGAVGSWNGTAWSNLGQTFNSVVRSVCTFGGALCAGGDFVLVGSNLASQVARWNGTGWQPLGIGPGQAYGLAEWNGKLVASSVSGITYSVTAWDETSWQTLGVAGIGAVDAVAAFGADLYAMGGFNTLGGVFTGSVARWNGAAWATSTAAGLDSEVLALTTWKGDLVAGGSFRTASVANTHGIARFDGLAWHALGTGISGPGTPRIGALATYNGDLIAAGLFPLAGGVAAANIARWDGTSWYSLGPGLSGVPSPASEEPHRIVRQLVVYNGELYAAGYLTSTGSGMPLSFIGRWNGSTWQAVGTGTNGPIHALCIYNGELYAGGGFSLAGGVGVTNVARWNGSAWQSAGGAGPAGPVHALVVHDGGLYAGGQFVTCAGQAVNGIARWDGVAWSAPPPVGNNSVKALASYDGDLVAASTNWALPTGFTAGLARLSGGSWTSLGSGLTILQNPTADGVRVLAVHQGALFAGGWFSTAGGVGSPLLARWSRPLPWVSAGQTTSGSVRIRDAWLVPGHEYYNLASLDLCPGGPGTGPWGGLCANDVNVLWQQVALPLGTTPFHFAATATTADFGPFTLPPGLAFEAISIDLTGGVVGCISTAVRYTVY